MHGVCPENIHKNGNRSWSQCNGIPEDKKRYLAGKAAVEFDNFRIDAVHHLRMENNFQDVQIGYENLIKQPWDIKGEPNDLTEEIFFNGFSEQQVPGKIRDDETGNNAQ